MDFLNNLAFGFNVMVAKEVAEAAGETILDGPTIGTGAWLIECEADVQCIYTKNPTFHLKDESGNSLPYLDGMRNIIMPDVQARFAAFRAKKLETYGLTPEKYQIYERNYKDDWVITQTRSYSGSMIHFRTDQAPWNDKRVRTAVSKAIDRQEIIDTLFNGKAFFSYSMI